MQARIEFCCSSLYICHLFAETPTAFIMRPTPPAPEVPLRTTDTACVVRVRVYRPFSVADTV